MSLVYLCGCICASGLACFVLGGENAAAEGIEATQTVAYGETLVPIPDERWAQDSISISDLPTPFTRRLLNRLALTFKKDAPIVAPASGASGSDERKAVLHTSSHPELPDVIKIEATYQGRSCSILCTSNAIRTVVDLPQKDAAEFAENFAEVNYALDGTYSNYGTVPPATVEYSVEIPWAMATKNGARYSSDAGRSILSVSRWNQRVDTIVRGRQLSIITYTPDFPHGSLWPVKFTGKN